MKREMPAWTPSYGLVLSTFKLDLNARKPQYLTQLVPNACLVAGPNPSSTAC